MISFVNAKVNIGLQIVRKREDGYHDLQTIFYPVGKYAGTAGNPESFCDILEIVKDEKGNGAGMPSIILTGREVNCPIEKNLVYKAARLFSDEVGADLSDFSIMLEKHLPDGAGMGGGSADASFTLRMLAELYNRMNPGAEIEDKLLYEMALRLGADCPFFILNHPAYAEGVGEKLEEIPLDLSGLWMVVVKPAIYISTKEAFSGVSPREADFDLRQIVSLPVGQWREQIKNDFEDSIIPLFPAIGELKSLFYSYGALYSSMSGSGSSVYAIFSDQECASAACKAFRDFKGNATIEGSYLLKL